MTQLYEISNVMSELLQLEEDESVIGALAELQLDFNEKAESIIFVERNTNVVIEGIDNEVKRLQARKKTMQNRVSRLKEYLRENMERTGITKIECPLFTITCAKGRDVAEVVDSNALDDKYVIIKVEEKPDKAKILSDLKAGVDVAGARLSKGKSSIRIK